MSSHKYWRVSNIVKRTNEGDRSLTVGFLNFINLENVPCDNLSNVIVQSFYPGYPPTNAFDSNQNDYTMNNHPSFNYTEWWIGYKFDIPIEVSAIKLQMYTGMGSDWGHEWQSANVDYSDDGTNWSFYGSITPRLARLDLALKTIPIEKIKTDLELPVGDYWWNIVTNSNPIFAIDSTSQIEFEGSVLRYANNPNNYFVSQAFTKNAVEKSNCYGTKAYNYTQLFDYFYSYKSLRFKKISFKFKEVLNYPENFTLILCTKVYTNSCFLGKSKTGADHGPAWERVPESSQQYVYNWRYDLEITGQNYSYNKREEVLNPHISYVVYTGNLGTGKVKAYTPYGVYDLTIGKHFRSDVNIDLLGFTSTSWNIDADIIAFGVFDKEFTTEEISSVLSKIETDFKIDQKVISTSKSTQLLFNNSIEELITNSEKIKMNLYNFYKPIIQKSNNMLSEKIYTKNLKISKYHNISDYIYEEGQPVISKIFLIERRTGQLIATTMSNQLGYFEFKDIDKNLEYMVISPHKQYQFKSVLKDYTK